MTKPKLGIRLHRNKRTPAFLRKLLHLRWEYNGNKLEQKYRSENPGTIFSIPFSDSEHVLFDLPDVGDLISRDLIVQKRFFELHYLNAVKKLIINPTCIIDVGANIGNHSIFFKKCWPRAAVYSFEPQVYIFDQLERNLEINGLPLDGCFNVAVGNKKGRGKVVFDGRIQKNMGATRIDYDDSGSFYVISLDEFIKNHPHEKIDLIKIDVEGFELKVLDGMRQLIEIYKPLIWIEVLDNNKDAALLMFEQLNLEFVDCFPFNTEHDFLLSKK